MRGRAPRNLRLNGRAERESRQDERLAERFSRVGDNAKHVLGFTNAFVVPALGRADSAEIGAQRHVAELGKGPGKSLHDLVVERAAVKRMGMSDQSRASRCVGGTVDHRFDFTCAAVDENTLDCAAHIRRR